MNHCSFTPRSSQASRIQIFVSDLSATGVVRNAVAIANQAANHGYEVRLLTCAAEGVLRDQIDRRVSIVKLSDSARLSATRKTRLKRVLRAYRRHTREWRPDILLSAGNHGHLLSTFAWLGLGGTKILRISNDLDHALAGGRAALGRRLKFRLITMLADKLVLVSRAHSKDPLLSGMIARGKALVIPNGVDVQAVRAASMDPCPHPWTAKRDIPIVLAVGRHARQKNFETLLKAFAAAHVIRKLRLIILGEDHAEESKKLHKLAVRLGVAAHVEFVQTTPNPFPYMASAHALVLPSLWEGSSNVLLEALACGTPVVASRTAGDADALLSGGKFGILIDPMDEQALTAAILKQTGPDAIYPENRALAFNRAVCLEDYMRMFRQCTGPIERARPAHAASDMVNLPVIAPANRLAG